MDIIPYTLYDSLKLLNIRPDLYVYSNVQSSHIVRKILAQND